VALTAKGIDPRVFSALSDRAVFSTIREASSYGISRAELARATGFSKPTISAVVSDFIEAGLLRTTENNEVGALGRPATKFKLAPEAGFVLAADIGATKTIVAVTDLLGNIIAEEKFSTGSSAQECLRQLVAKAKAMMPSGKPGSVCIGVPGVYQLGQDRVEQAVNLPGFEEIAVASYLSESLELEDIQIENDVNLAAAAEAIEGGDSNLVAISVGTGIGLGIILGGNLYRGHSGAAGELGSLWLVPPHSNGQKPHTVEDVASALAMRKLFKAALQDGYASSLGPDADVPKILVASQSGDAAAQHVLAQAADAMALAVAHLTMIFDPARIVFGGGLGQNLIFVEAVRERVLSLVPYPSPMSASNMGGRATLLGAISVARESLHANIISRKAEGVSK